MARKKDNPLLASVPTVCECGGKVIWKNGRHFYCIRCYVDKICPQVTAVAADIAFQKRLREVNEWIAKHPEFKSKRLACLHILKKRGLTHALPESLRE